MKNAVEVAAVPVAAGTGNVHDLKIRLQKKLPCLFRAQIAQIAAVGHARLFQDLGGEVAGGEMHLVRQLLKGELFGEMLFHKGDHILHRIVLSALLGKAGGGALKKGEGDGKQILQGVATAVKVVGVV